jgi:hypothetical protein
MMVERERERERDERREKELGWSMEGENNLHRG